MSIKILNELRIIDILVVISFIGTIVGAYAMNEKRVVTLETNQRWVMKQLESLAENQKMVIRIQERLTVLVEQHLGKQIPATP